MKKILLLLFYVFILNTLNCDVIETIFNSDFSSIEIEKNNSFKNLNYVGNAYLLDNNSLIYKRGEEKKYTVIYRAENNEELLFSGNFSYKLSVELTDSIFVNESQSKAIYSTMVINETGNNIMKRFLIDFNRFTVTDTTIKAPSLERDFIYYWKDDSFINKSQSFFTLYFENNGIYSSAKNPYSPDKIDNFNDLKVRYVPLLLDRSFEIAFYTKPTLISNDGKVQQVGLFACDTENKIKKVDIIELNKDDFFEIKSMQASAVDNNYLIIFGRKYNRSSYSGAINFMAIIRKKDLKVRYYDIESSNLEEISFKCGQYIVEDNKIRLLNSQYDKTFIALVFNKGQNDDKEGQNNHKKDIVAQIYYVTVDNLRLRRSPSTSSGIIKNLHRLEKVKILTRGRVEVINKIKGQWVEVLTEEGKLGWCFDAYLEEVK